MVDVEFGVGTLFAMTRKHSLVALYHSQKCIAVEDETAMLFLGSSDYETLLFMHPMGHVTSWDATLVGSHMRILARAGDGVREHD